MPSYHGQFCWYELMTTDVEGAKAFYSEVAGWKTEDVPMPGMTYALLKAGEVAVAGAMALPKEAIEAGVAPFWLGYIAVEDVDIYVEKVLAAGGSLQKPADDIPGIGRFAAVADPHGATFVIFKGVGNEMPPAPTMPSETGFFAWRELMAGDREADFAFYSSLFGWTKGEVMENDGDGPYQIFEIAGAGAGGMMTKPATVPRVMWSYYILVDSIDAAADRVATHRGRIINGPLPVPQDMWILQGLDPQGAIFCLLGPK